SPSSSSSSASAPGSGIPEVSISSATVEARSSAVVSTPSCSVPRTVTTRGTAPMARATATTSTAAAVVRRRTEARRHRISPTVARQPVAGATEGLDRIAAEGPVDLVAQMADVDLDDVRVALEVDVPHRLEDLTLGDH